MTVPLPDPDRDARRMRAILLLAGAVVFPLVAVLMPPFTGYAPDAFPVPQDRPPVQPAGFTFAIWGLIYAALFAHAAWGVFARADDPGWDAPRLPLTVSLVIGAAWIAIAQTSPVAATIAIFAMLALALLALWRAPGREALLGRVPLALYAGWLTAAAFVSLGLVVGGYGLAGTDAGAALVVLVPAILAAAAVQRRLGRVPAYGAAVAWGLFGIAVANWPDQILIALLALAGIAALGLTLWRAPSGAS
jgi:hypothetical protein